MFRTVQCGIFAMVISLDQFFILSAPVMTIRSEYYVGVLLHRLGIEFVAQIPATLDGLAELSDGNSFSKYRSDLFRYHLGGNIRNPGLVRDINIALPGTARIISHPIWPLISNPIDQEDELIWLAQKIDPKLMHYIIEYNETTQEFLLKDLSKNYFWIKGGSKFLRLIDRRGLDELAALLIAVKAQEIQGNYRAAYYLREIVTGFFSEISRLSEFRKVAAQIYTQVYRLFVGVIYKGASKNDGMFDFMLSTPSVSPDYMIHVIERIASGEFSHDDNYSNILRGRRNYFSVECDQSDEKEGAYGCGSPPAEPEKPKQLSQR